MINKLFQKTFLSFAIPSTIFSTTLLTSHNNANSINQQLINKFDIGYVAQDLRVVVRKTQLGTINIPRDILSMNSEEKIALIKHKITRLNPDVDLSYLDLINVTDTSAILVSEKDESKYFGTVRITYIFKQTTEEEEELDLVDLDSVIIVRNLGAIKLKNDIQKKPTDFELINRIIELNFRVWRDNLIVTNITKNKATVYGDGEQYRGKIEVSFETVSVFEWHESLIKVPKKPDGNRITWESLISDFLNKTSNVWNSRNNQTFWTLRSIIHDNIFRYFGLEMNILQFIYYEGWGKRMVRIPPSHFRTSYIANRGWITFMYKFKIPEKNNEWSKIFDLGDSIPTGINESLKLKERIELNPRKNPIFKHKWTYEDELIDYVRNNGQKLIDIYLKSDRFKTFYKLYSTRRWSIEIYWDFPTTLVKEWKALISITIDPIRDNNISEFEMPSQVRALDYVVFQRT